MTFKIKDITNFWRRLQLICVTGTYDLRIIIPNLTTLIVLQIIQNCLYTSVAAKNN